MAWSKCIELGGTEVVVNLDTVLFIKREGDTAMLALNYGTGALAVRGMSPNPRETYVQAARDEVWDVAKIWTDTPATISFA